MINDPTGAKVVIWEPRKHAGAGIMNELNSVCWTELATTDTAKATEFYWKLFEWKPQVKSMGPAGDYTEWSVAGAPQNLFAGMLQMTPEWGEMPSHWSVYLKVADPDAIAAAATKAGGKVIVGPFDAPGVGRLALLQDPAGATFYIIHLTLAGR